MVLNEFEEIFDSVYPQQINLKSFERKKTLCPAIWSDDELKQKVRRQLLRIADDFISGFDEFNLVPVDIVVVGSIAGFNWSSYSDIDLHIIVDMSKLSKYGTKEVLKSLFDNKKNIWNDKHEIEIYGYEIEMYVQDVNEENASDGVYSVKYDRWVKIPKVKDAYLNRSLIKKQSSQYINIIEKLDELGNKKLNASQFETLYNIACMFNDEIMTGRRGGLTSEGENSAGNIVFKVLRRSGHLGKLKELKVKFFDKMSSLYA